MEFLVSTTTAKNKPKNSPAPARLASNLTINIYLPQFLLPEISCFNNVKKQTVSKDKTRHRISFKYGKDLRITSQAIYNNSINRLRILIEKANNILTERTPKGQRWSNKINNLWIISQSKK